MSPSTRRTRRGVLALCGASMASLAGCSALAADDGRTVTTELDCGPERHGWSGFGVGPARTGDAPSTELPDPDTPVETVFEAAAGAGPAVADGVAYAVGGGSVAAVGVDSGELLWRTDEVGAGSITPALGCGAAFVTALNDTYALDRETGEVAWSVRDGNGAGDRGEGPIAVDGTLYKARGRVSAHDATDGSERWTATDTDLSTMGVAVGDRLYATGWDGEDEGGVVSVTPTGEVWWERLGYGHVYAAPVVADGRVFVVAKSGVVAALDAADGTELWRDRIAGAGTDAEPAVADGRVFVAAGNTSTVRALDAETGDRLWTRRTGIDHTAPTVVGDVVLVAGNGVGLYGLDVTTGETRWYLDEGVGVRPVAVDGRLFLADVHGTHVLG